MILTCISCGGLYSDGTAAEAFAGKPCYCPPSARGARFSGPHFPTAQDRTIAALKEVLAFCDGVLLVVDGKDRDYNPEGVKEARRRIASALKL